MKITSSYNLNLFKVNEQVNDQQLLTKPSFRARQKILTQGVQKVVPPAIAMVSAGTVLAMHNGKVTEPESITKTPDTNEVKNIPTKEEFQNILKEENIIHSKYTRQEWLAFYEKNPEKTLNLYYLTDKAGNRFATLSMPHSENIEDFDLFKEILETETENEIQPFTFQDAGNILFATRYYQNGLRTMLSLRDDDGNLRFTNWRDYELGVKAFEENPEIATDLANVKDDLGNYRYSGYTIDRLVEAATIDKYPTEKLDNFMNLKRPDGTYVNDDFNPTEMSFFLENPEIYTKLCGLRTANSNKYIPNDEISYAIFPYARFPKETEEILQMKFKNKARFSTRELNENPLAALTLREAPKSFKILANTEYYYDNRFKMLDLSEIVELMNTFELAEKEKTNPAKLKETLAMIKTFLSITPASDIKLTTEQMKEASKSYNKYPQETIEIIQNYVIEEKTPAGRIIERTQIPTEDDTKLYKENREKFDKIYG